MRKIPIALCLVLLFSGLVGLQNLLAQSKTIKPRIIITADPELDDNNSLIRFLLYSDQFQVEGLIYASSQFHWKGDGKGTKFMVPGREYTKFGLNLCPCESYRWNPDEKFIHNAVDAYAKVYSNLKIHDAAYPSPDYLKSKIRYGNIDFEGAFSKNTEGSDLIKSLILDKIPGPLYITAWGGQSTIARALKSIEEEHQQDANWKPLKAAISKKVILLPSGDQDNTYASYIQINWPSIDYRQYQKGPNYGYGAQLNANPDNAALLTSVWMRENILSKGPFGSIYRVWGDGKQMVKGDPFDYFGLDGFSNEELKKMGYIVWMPKQEKDSWLGEGDTGTFMNILDNGLEAFDEDTPGGWAGRPFHPDPKTYIDPFSNDTTKIKETIISEAIAKEKAAAEAKEFPFPNFFPAAQNDFAARMKWSVTNQFSAANHAPIIKLKSSALLKAKPGETIQIAADVVDPDGDDYTIKWWQFKRSEKETTLGMNNINDLKLRIAIPNNATEKIFYVVMEVKDKKDQPLTRYQLYRIVI
jgi:Protein of unknown function (DUF1593)